MLRRVGDVDWSAVVGACIRSTIQSLTYSGDPLDGIP